MQAIETFLVAFAGLVWGPPLLALLVGGGLGLLVYSRGLPLRGFGHAVAIISGRYDDPHEPGEITHFQALTSALSGTIGLGNIAGVAVAIQVGGPGAVFWMWVSALLGIATKFFTCTLAVLYRGRDEKGQALGGPMYIVVEGLGPRWRPLAILFAVAGLCGTLPLFQANQLTAILRGLVLEISGSQLADSSETLAFANASLLFDGLAGGAAAALVAAVILGGITRIGAVTARLVPIMVSVYLGAIGWILVAHADAIAGALSLIVSDAFSGQAAAGGALAHVIMTGIRRGAFSNEAGIGTEVMAHGAARTREPVREGLVGMLGPVVDTLVVCTGTALAILVTDAWLAEETGGVAMTALAFARGLPGAGMVSTIVLAGIVAAFALSTMITFAWYGEKCLIFLGGARYASVYRWIYLSLIVVGSMGTLNAAVAFIDGMYALMAIPTMTATLLLAPRVLAEAKDYFERMAL